MSSIAAQLAKSASLNASLFVDRSRRKPAESYLFDSREANQHDFHSLHALGLNGLSKLISINPKFSRYEDNVFSDAARGLDRTLQSETQNAELDRTLNSFLRDLGPYLLEAPSSKALEWLVRRFRINEFNVDALMALFLPYHETAHFTKMVSILHVKNSRLWSFLSPLKKAAKPLPRSMLVNEMVANIDVARFVINILPDSLGNASSYSALIGFTASVVMDYLMQFKSINEDVVTLILPSLSRLFANDSTHDCVLAGCITLASLSQRSRLSQPLLLAVLVEILKAQKHIKAQSILPFLVALLGPQDQLDDFSKTIASAILSLPNIDHSLADSLRWVGGEKLVIPLLPHLISRPISLSIINSIILSEKVPESVIRRLSRLFLETLSGSEDQEASQLLSMIFQRHGSIFSEVSSDLLKTTKSESCRVAFEEIIRFISNPYLTTGPGRVILSSASADAGSRAMAVRDLLEALSQDNIEHAALRSIYEALTMRVADTSVAVIETLYSNPKTVLPALGSTSFIDAVSSVLKFPDISRAVMRLHFAFIAGPFYVQNQELAPAIFEHVFLPYLLFTKPRRRTAGMVWQVLSNIEFGSYELLEGCSEIIAANLTTEETTHSVDDMSAINLALTARIANNIMSMGSRSYSSHLEMFLRQLKNTDAHVLNMSYLILRSLLVSLTGEHQVSAAKQILSSMGLQSLDSLHDVSTNANNLQETISDDVLMKAVVAKPNNVATLHRLQVGILALLPFVRQPADIRINWLEESTLQSLTDMRGQHFSELARAVYRLASSSSAAVSLSTNLLKALFINLREDALLFLAGIWTGSLLADPDSLHLSRTALLHGTAFLQAQVTGADQPQDYQVILPSLLVALQARQASVRSAAMDCIGIIAQSTHSAVPSSVYALDSVYGNLAEGLQYLEWSDFGRFVAALSSRREHCINDGDYIRVFVQESLRKLRSDGKKDAAYKQRVLCYLLSHIITWNFTPARVVLLETLKNISNRVKLQMLLPVIQVVSNGGQIQRVVDAENLVDAKYYELLIGLYDVTVAPDLNETGSESWITFVRLLRLAFDDEIVPLRIREAVFDQLNSGLFESLSAELRLEVSIVLIECATRSEDNRMFIKANIKNMLKDHALIVSLLVHFRAGGKDATQRTPKRARVVVDPLQDSDRTPLRLLATLLDILIAQPLAGSIELMSTALDTLTQIWHAHASQPEANYVTQLLMTMLDNITTSVAPTTTLTSSSIRMEILVELLRVSDNPQIFNQTLLLIANLARLAPEFVMQNIMPIFTFMGSNVFHRDDSYSFRVVQKTVNSIVPVVITSLKNKHPGTLHLQKAASDFLCVFTDAATHVPRHRRTHFFNHLVEVLGPAEFVVPVCLLLVDKVAHKLVRQKAGEVGNTLSLPLNIVQANFKQTPFNVIREVLQEATRLFSRFADPDTETFLNLSQEGDLVATTKKQIQAIVIFVDLILQQSPRKGIIPDQAAIEDIVRTLLNFANYGRETPESTQYSEISKVSIKALGHLLRVTSVREFVSTVSILLSSKNATVENGVLNLLASRLVNVTDKMRQEVSPTLITIIDHLCGQFEKPLNTQYLRSVLDALRAIAQTADSQEIPALTKALPLILHAVRDQKEVIGHAVVCILPFSVKIGPRVLPMYREVVQFCRDVLSSPQVATSADHLRVEENAHAILLGLLSSISQFWTVDELVKLGELSLDSRPSFLNLRKTMAKRVPAKQMLPALCRIWSESKAMQSSTWSSREAFFDLLKRTMRNAPRDDIHLNIRDVFTLFLEAFDICGGAVTKAPDTFETIVLSAFVSLVMKLNEAAFKPLFHRLFDWAFTNILGRSVSRQITFNHVLTSLIKLLKGLITPYMGIVLTPLADLFATFEANRANFEHSGQLWLSAVELLWTSLVLDEGSFWREDKLSQLGTLLVNQINICPSLEVADDARTLLKQTLSALVAIIDDDSSLKKVHLQILMKTRSESAQVRVFALQCAEYLWEAHGDKLIGFVTDIVTFIAESAEDEHDDVAKAARALKRTAEKRCGSLDMLMQ